MLAITIANAFPCRTGEDLACNVDLRKDAAAFEPSLLLMIVSTQCTSHLPCVSHRQPTELQESFKDLLQMVHA